MNESALNLSALINRLIAGLV